jgi:hypothetical protein
MTPEETAVYFNGIREGIRRYAWWKNGLEYVGVGKKLHDALEETRMEEKEETDAAEFRAGLERDPATVERAPRRHERRNGG